MAGAPPLILVVDDDDERRVRVHDELEHRYAADYRIAAVPTAGAAAELEAAAGRDEPVALVLAGASAAELLPGVARLHPAAKRALVIDWGDWGNEETAALVREAMAKGWTDYYVLRPWHSPDELFHRSVTEFLHEWRRADPPRSARSAWSPIRRRPGPTSCARCWPGTAYPTASTPAPRTRADGFSRTSTAWAARHPVVVLHDETALDDPDNVELARGYGVATEIEPGKTFDVVVVGGGPPGWPHRCTRRPKVSTAWWWSARRSAGRLGRALGSGTTWASHAAWAGPSSRSAPTSNRGSSARPFCSCARSRAFRHRRRSLSSRSATGPRSPRAASSSRWAWPTGDSASRNSKSSSAAESSTGRPVGRASVRGRTRLRRGWGQLGRPGGGTPEPVRRPGHPRRPRFFALGDDVPVPRGRARRAGERRRPVPDAG